MTGWGSGSWGDTPWGYGIPTPVLTPASIIPIDPVENATGVAQEAAINIRFTDELEVLEDTITIAVNGAYYVIGGVAQQGAIYAAIPNTLNGVDITLNVPTAFTTGQTHEVFVTCMDSSGFLSTKTYYFTTGVGMRMLSVRNPKDEVLVVYFNKPTRQNDEFFFTGNWIVTPLDGGDAMTITRVTGNPTNPHGAHLRYTGGTDGGLYELRAVSIVSQNGEQLETGYDRAEFTLVFGAEPEQTIRLFDTIYGPVGIAQGIQLRRSMDEHCAQRATSLGIDEQLSLRRAALDDTVGRDGRPGARRLE